MPHIPTPLIWKRRNFAVLEDMGMVDRLTALATSGIVSRGRPEASKNGVMRSSRYH